MENLTTQTAAAIASPADVDGYGPGPVYPDLAASRKWRGKERTPENDAAYGMAVLAEIGAKNMAVFGKATPLRSHCASGTWLSDGMAILAAVGRQNIERAQRAVDADRRKRTVKEIEAAYAATMRENAESGYRRKMLAPIAAPVQLPPPAEMPAPAPILPIAEPVAPVVALVAAPRPAKAPRAAKTKVPAWVPFAPARLPAKPARLSAFGLYR